MAQRDMARVVATAALVVAVSAALPGAASAEEPPASIAQPSDCTWPAAGGAVAGLAVAWYGFVGLYAAGGGSAFDLDPTAGNVAAILALEWVGMVGGATAACAIWGDEHRWFPTAGTVITFGLVGGGAGMSLAYAVIRGAEIDADTDNPIASVFIALAATTLGALGGGYLGFALDRAVRGPPASEISITPVASADSLGVELTYAP